MENFLMIKVQSQIPDRKMEYLIISLEHLNGHLEQDNLEIIPHTAHFNKLKMIGNLNVNLNHTSTRGKWFELFYNMRVENAFPTTI